jgi:hypothetical protein
MSRDQKAAQNRYPDALMVCDQSYEIQCLLRRNCTRPGRPLAYMLSFTFSKQVLPLA